MTQHYKELRRPAPALPPDPVPTAFAERVLAERALAERSNR